MADADDSSPANSETPPVGNTLSSILSAAVMRRISLPKFLSVSGSARSIQIDQVILNNTTVDQVDVANINTEVDTGQVTLENARTIVTLALRFNYGIHIPLPWPIPDINISDSVSLGGISFPFEIGDIEIPRLDNVDLEIPSATLEDIQASIAPVNNLDLGGAGFNGLMLDSTLLPAAGFGLSGMSLGPLSLNEVEVPSVTSEALKIDGFTLDNSLQLPSLTIENIQLPTASAPSVSTVAPVVVPDITAETRNIPLTDFLLRTSIDITPTLTMAISSMVINDISAVSSIGRVDIRDVQSTVAASGVNAEGIELNNVEIESVATTG